MIVESYEDLIILSGALKSNFWDTVHTAISLALKRSPEGVIIDCAQITECTMEGADTFRDIMHFLEDHDARVLVAAVPESVMKVLRDVPEVRSQLPIADSVESARASLHRLSSREDDSKRKKKKSEVPAKATYLICLSRGNSDPYALQVACEHAEVGSAEMLLMVPILVPRDLPLQSPLKEQESIAEIALQESAAYCEDHNVAYRVQMNRGRDIASIIQETLEENQVHQVFVPLDSDHDDHDRSARLVKTILAKVKHPVLFVRDKTVG